MPTQEEQWAEERLERTRFEHDSFFDLPADALTDAERRTQAAFVHADDARE